LHVRHTPAPPPLPLHDALPIWSVNDYGLVLSAQAEAWPDEPLLARMLGVDGVLDDLRASLNLAELARRQFREIARVAGLLPPSLDRKSTRLNSSHVKISYAVFC